MKFPVTGNCNISSTFPNHSIRRRWGDTVGGEETLVPRCISPALHFSTTIACTDALYLILLSFLDDCM